MRAWRWASSVLLPPPTPFELGSGDPTYITSIVELSSQFKRGVHASVQFAPLLVACYWLIEKRTNLDLSVLLVLVRPVLVVPKLRPKNSMSQHETNLKRRVQPTKLEANINQCNMHGY